VIEFSVQHGVVQSSELSEHSTVTSGAAVKHCVTKELISRELAVTDCGTVISPDIS
jgi:hypothetical protein